VSGDALATVEIPPPGPASRALSARAAAVEAPTVNALGPADEPALGWAGALGATVRDVDGNLYLDFTSGFGVAAIGHRHPKVVAAIARQAGELVHGLGDAATHPRRVELAERLAALAPVDDARVHFAISGADAVEIAIKTAVAATGRATILAFDPAYHGTTLGALAATSRAAFRAPFARHLHPHVARLPFGAATERCAEILARGDVAAVVVEPVVGREGVLVPPAGWLAELAAAARAHGALLLADEILTGFGRTGARFAVDVEGVRPDLLCVGKALGGGMPIAAVVGRRELLEVWRVSGEALHTATFLAHPLACAAALATLDVLDEEDLVARARALGETLGPRLTALAERHARVVRDARGRGALWALELATPELARRVAERTRAAGLLLLCGGASGRVVELAPPFVISADEVGFALSVLDRALEEVA